VYKNKIELLICKKFVNKITNELYKVARFMASHLPKELKKDPEKEMDPRKLTEMPINFDIKKIGIINRI